MNPSISSSSAPEHSKEQDFWRKAIRPYVKPHTGRATWQVVNSLVPYIALWWLMTRTIEVSLLLTFALSIIAAGFLVRLFIINHDCGHGSFFHSRHLNNLIGSISSFLTFVPYATWRYEHAMHHAGSGNLDRRGFGDVTTLTKNEYLSLSLWGRLQYRIYRNPLVIFGPGALFLFTMRYRVAVGHSDPRYIRSVHKTNLALVAYIAAMCWMIGWKDFLIIQTMVITGAASAGVWLFYVQHQFEDTYWERSAQWDYVSAAMEGSSYYELPKVLQWFSGNIGFHHLHHLSPLIPNYYLEKCHKANPEFQKVRKLTLLTSLECLRYRLWDEEAGRMISFRDLRKQRKLKKAA